MRKYWCGMAALAALAATMAPATVTAASAATAPATSAAAAPAAGKINAGLFGVDTRSATDAWAVGGATTIATDKSQALIEHWDGTSWTKVASPTVLDSNLVSVSADSATDAWAVGLSPYAAGQQTQLIEHWNGASWTKVTTPTIPAATHLTSVSAVSPADVWAVGYYYATSGGLIQAVVLHWTGSSWTMVASPAPAAGVILYGVSATSATSAWAVGASATHTFIEHWNGKSWTKSTSPSVVGTLTGVSADSAADVWATGYTNNIATGTGKTLILHHTGTGWTRTTSPSPGTSQENWRLNVSAVSPTEVWAAGYENTKGGVTPDKTLILRGTGTGWKQVASPSPGTVNDGLWSVSADSAADAWAVGDYGAATTGTLIVHWNGTGWKKVTSPN